jgi:hypothetical protein
MARSSDSFVFRAAISFCNATAQATAFTTLGNSARKPSPIDLNSRPWCSAILVSITSTRRFRTAVKVPSSSMHMSRL